MKGRPAAPACRAAVVVANRALAIGALAAILALLGATYSRAQNELNVQFHHFQDTRGVTVLSPTVDLSQDFTDRTTLAGQFRRRCHLGRLRLVRAVPSSGCEQPAPGGQRVHHAQVWRSEVDHRRRIQP